MADIMLAGLAAASPFGNAARSYGSALRFEPGLELGIELVQAGLHPTGDVSPTPIFERGDSDSQFEFDGILGLKVTTAVAADDFELTIHGFDRIGSGQGTTNGIGILEEGEIVVAFLAQFRHKSRIVVVEALAEFFELSDADLFIPGGS